MSRWTVEPQPGKSDMWQVVTPDGLLHRKGLSKYEATQIAAVRAVGGSVVVREPVDAAWPTDDPAAFTVERAEAALARAEQITLAEGDAATEADVARYSAALDRVIPVGGDPEFEADAAPPKRIDAHYASMKIQPLAYSLANGLDADQHTVVKYVTSYKTRDAGNPDKGGVRDLRAAIRVIEQMIERAEGGDPYNLRGLAL